MSENTKNPETGYFAGAESVTFKKALRGWLISFCIGLVLGAAEFAALMLLGDGNPDLVITTGLAGIVGSVVEVWMRREQLPTKKAKVLHFVLRAAVFTGVTLVGVIAGILSRL